MHGSFACKDNVAPAFTLRDALNEPRRDLERLFTQVADEDLDETASILPRVITGVRAVNHGVRR